MRSYTIMPKTDSWNDIPVAPLDTRLQTPEIDISATAQVCYDAEALYLRLTAKEANIRAEESGLLGVPCKDSCLEFFFSPIADDTRYFNFEFNSVKCMHLGFGTLPDCFPKSPKNFSAPAPSLQQTVGKLPTKYPLAL